MAASAPGSSLGEPVGSGGRSCRAPADCGRVRQQQHLEQTAHPRLAPAGLASPRGVTKCSLSKLTLHVAGLWPYRKEETNFVGWL